MNIFSLNNRKQIGTSNTVLSSVNNNHLVHIRNIVYSSLAYFLLLIITTNFVCAQQNRPPKQERKQETTKEELIRKLIRLENEFSSNMRYRQKSEFKGQIDDILSILENSEIIENRIFPISDAQFEYLLRDMDNARFSNDKHAILSSAARNNYFTIDQTIQILEKYKFDNEKLEAVKIVYPVVLDMDNNFRLYSQFKFDKKDLTEYLKNAPNRPIVDKRTYNNQPENRRYTKPNEIYPVDENKLRLIIDGYKKNHFEKDKLQYIQTIAEQNFFLVKQVIDIIKSSGMEPDNTKLSIIKILYPKIIDTENNFMLYDCLTFSSTKEELGEFMRSEESGRNRIDGK